MAAVSNTVQEGGARYAIVHVDYVRTANDAGVPKTETVFHRQGEQQDGEQETLEDLEERIRRLAVHHLNDQGIPVSAKRAFAPEATPEIPFVLSAAKIALKYVPAVYRGASGWWRTRQERSISSYYQTAAISIDLWQTFDRLKLSAIAGLPILEQKIQKEFPGVKIHVTMTWGATADNLLNDLALRPAAHHSLAIACGCIQPGPLNKLLKMLDPARGGSLNQNLVVLCGRRWRSLFFNRVWVLPQDDPWAVKRKHVRT